MRGCPAGGRSDQGKAAPSPRLPISCGSAKGAVLTAQETGKSEERGGIVIFCNFERAAPAGVFRAAPLGSQCGQWIPAKWVNPCNPDCRAPQIAWLFIEQQDGGLGLRAKHAGWALLIQRSLRLMPQVPRSLIGPPRLLRIASVLWPHVYTLKTAPTCSATSCGPESLSLIEQITKSETV
jgi:hypothetical protein